MKRGFIFTVLEEYILVWLVLAVRRAAIVSLGLLLVSCDEPVFTELRIYSSPYANADWVNDYRLLSQHHDHFLRRPMEIMAYDLAGYDVLSLMDYSGNVLLPYALTERMWPPENWVTNFVLANLRSVKFFIPNAEEVGLGQHATSPFLAAYIQGRSTGVPLADNEYTSIPEMFAMVRRYGGLPCLAHPWTYNYESIPGTFCVEIYSAYAEAQRRSGREEYVATDANLELLKNWDRALENNQDIVGIAVNDHYGPNGVDTADDIRDSGKIVVLAGSATPEAYREAFETGAVLAVRDRSVPKGQYPRVQSIVVDEFGVRIETDDSVSWLTRGREISNSATLVNSDLPPNARYVRAEISGADGSVVYTQAFRVRPVGDVDGDYDIDEQDRAICEAIATGEEAGIDFAAACVGTD